MSIYKILFFSIFHLAFTYTIVVWRVRKKYKTGFERFLFFALSSLQTTVDGKRRLSTGHSVFRNVKRAPPLFFFLLPAPIFFLKEPAPHF